MSIDGTGSSEYSDSSTARSNHDDIPSEIIEGEKKPAAIIHICLTYTLFTVARISDGGNAIETNAARRNNDEGIAELKEMKKYHQNIIRGE